MSPEKILSGVEVWPVGCWVWTGSKSGDGYGRVKYNGRGQQVLGYTHRMVWEYLVGPIPEGMVMDHLCLNKPCCNPDHLEVVTYAENYHRSWWAKSMGAKRRVA